MNLFIEPPSRAVGRDHGYQGQPYGVAAAARDSAPPREYMPDNRQPAEPLDLDEVAPSRPQGKRASRREIAERVVAPYSTVQEAYREELAYGKRRDRHIKRAQVLKLLVGIVLFPVVLALVFIAAYALTCIANGASPSELADMMTRLFERVGSFAESLFAAGTFDG